MLAFVQMMHVLQKQAGHRSPENHGMRAGRIEKLDYQVCDESLTA